MNTHRLLAGATVLALISGCGGGGTNAPAASAPPSISLSASSTSVEGGETVAFTINATDSSGAALTPSLTCNGGTVTGTLLFTSATATGGTITCTAQASDRAGTSASATATITVRASVARFELAPGTTVSQGQLAAILVRDLALSDTRYTATLGGRTITVSRGSASALSFLVPADMTPGAQRLDVTIGARQYAFALTVTAANTATDPRAAATSAINTALAAYDRVLASDGSAMSASERAVVQGYRNDLAAGLNQLGTLSAADLARLALLLQVNSDAARRTAAFDAARCNAAATAFVAKKIATIALLGGGITLIIIAPDPISKLAGLAAYGLGLTQAQDLGPRIRAVVDQCVNEPEFTVVSEPLAAAAARSEGRIVTSALSLGFTNKQPLRLRLRETVRVDASVADTIAAGVKQVVDLIASAPVPDSLKTAALTFTPERITDVPANELAIANISDANISGQLAGSGNVIALTFTYRGTPPSENVRFGFDLVRGTTIVPVTAQLVIALPSADDAAVTLVQGRSATAQLNVRGAESIEIVRAASGGTATIGTDGVLRYTPTGQFFGSDQVQFRARNANGVSRTATVAITVERQFEGTWRITTASRTTSETRAGLCPAENNSFDIVVAKVSDTQYTTSYAGFPLTLTMASRDDPNGLRGSTRVTYDDPPGQTTESLSVGVPNSSQLSGTSTFSYTSSSGSCSGFTTIEGRK